MHIFTMDANNLHIKLSESISSTLQVGLEHEDSIFCILLNNNESFILCRFDLHSKTCFQARLGI